SRPTGAPEASRATPSNTRPRPRRSTSLTTNSIQRGNESMRNIRDRRRKGDGDVPCGLAFDTAADEVVLAERRGDGSIRVSRVPRHEQQSALITSATVRTTFTGWSAHTDRTPLS